MSDLVESPDFELVPFKAGTSFEVEVLNVNRKRILCDLAGLTLGIIPNREFSHDSATLKAGDKVLAYVLTLENQDGYAVLSLKRADRERIWTTIKEREASGQPVSVKVVDTNRGGLLVDYSGLEGFLPASQLSSNHAKTNDGEREGSLRHLVGLDLNVKILSFDQNTNKLIFSEKAAGDSGIAEKAKSLPVGERMTGDITGVVPFGIFVRVGDVEGLVHISEIAWEKIDNVGDQFKVGDSVEVVVIGIEGSRVSLSMKRLKDDPWQHKAEQFKVGQKINGAVTRITPFGAFVRLDEGLDGLVHVSEMGDKVTDPHTAVTSGEAYDFEILSIEPLQHRISLRLLSSGKAKTQNEDEAVVAEAKAETKVEPKAEAKPEAEVEVQDEAETPEATTEATTEKQ